MKKSRKKLVRVDHQVSLLCAAMVLLSSFCIFFLGYSITYHDMIHGLQERVTAIYQYLECSIDKNTFQSINSKEDMDKNSYKTMKKIMEDTKNATGVMYLYTAKLSDDGSLIYVVDGLSETAPDFRFPGDKIEPEIQKDLLNALNGSVILPDRIKKTEWGEIFISYLPIHDDDKIIGVVGIEFEAQNQYSTYLMLKIFTPIICILLCLVATIFSFYFFRRISNPHYRDLSNTDGATQLKNRNAFDVDMNNITSQKSQETIGIISVDLNNLKLVNDTFGHSKGDIYIKLVADILYKYSNNNKIPYRIGGDEFAVIVYNESEIQIQKYLDRISTAVKSHIAEFGTDISIAAGFAIFDSSLDTDIHSTYKRADALMYVHKKIQKSSSRSIIS